MKASGTLILATLLAVASDLNAQTPDRSCWVRGNRAGLANRPSALDSTSVALTGGEVKVCYGAPKKNGRQIAGGLIPFGEPWRLGANEATSVYMPTRGTIAGVAVQPGWYSLYTVATENEWKIFVNSNTQRWGVPINDAVKATDVGSGTVRVETADAAQEALHLQLASAGANAATLTAQWDRTRVRIPIVLTR
jgi:hypothetical protein